MDVNKIQENELRDPNFQYGRWLSSPPAGEEVVISGMSGRFPESDNVYEFRDNLFNKTLMVTENEKRWKINHPDLPKRSAHINNINKLDAGYFGLHYRQADNLDPGMRVLMETVMEAIMDAGVNPLELEGSKTGVFIGFSYSDVENLTYTSMTESQKFTITGYFKSLFAHRLSYYLKLKGPSFVADTACSSSGNALHSAFKSMRSGQCEAAIVATCNLTIHPGTTIQFFRLGVLSPEGIPKVFDQDADGYVRSEACTCLLLQKSNNAKRIYARIVNTKVNCDGFKKEGITYPSSQMQKELMTEIYKESGINPPELSYVETHGTGTQAGDPEEVNAIDGALAKKCGKELLVGSVKSNMGHTEPASGLCSIVKVLIAMETRSIPPNINLKRIRKGLEGIEQKRMKIVTEATELLEHDAIVGVNNFGFGGNNCHVILQRFKKQKINGGLPKDDVPRLICVSGRTNEAVLKILNDVSSNNLDEEYVGLLHQLYKINNPNHLYRGYAVISKRGIVSMSSKLLPSRRPSLCVFFGQFVNNFHILASYLKKFSIFEYIETRVNQILVHNKVRTLKEILERKRNVDEDTLGSICLQLILVDILKELELFPIRVFGETSGKIATAYHYNVIQLNEAVSAAIKLSKVNSNSKDKNISKEDYSIYPNSYKPSKSTVVLNISDLRLNDGDNLLVENGSVNLLGTLGRLYTEGHLPQVHKLYPQVEFPVSTGTSMISPSIQWNHEKSWYTYKFSEFTSSEAEQKEYRISYLHEEHRFMKGHFIDGRNLFPATEYLHLVWQTYAQSRRLLTIDIPVLFENCKFIRAVTLPKSGYVKLLITIQRGTGNFEILEKDSLVVSGRIQICPNANKQQNILPKLNSFNDDKLEMLEQDEIYREFYLRGYNYSGLFKSIKRCNVDASAGLIKWEDNWSAFMDNMLQMKILQSDTRLLFVPVAIKKIIIDPIKHVEIVNQQDTEECVLPVYGNKNCNLIQSGGIEIHGVQVKSIFKKKPPLEPVLEKNVFIPNNLSLGLEEAVRVNTQIILENSLENNFKAVEIVNEFTDINAEHILGFVNKTLEDIPVVTPDLTISSGTTTNETPGIKFETVTLTSQSSILLYIGSKILEQSNALKQIFAPVSRNGFILTREDIGFNLEKDLTEADILTDYVTPNERIILLRRKVENVNQEFIEISSSSFNWISELQNALSVGKDVIAYATNRDPEGILGLINCIRRETSGNLVKCFFMMDDAPKFDPQHPFYSKQISKNLAVNIYKDKSWGTYRHLVLEERTKINCEHSYAHFKSRGDISSFEWLEGHLSEEVPLKEGQLLVPTYYASINFKDIMAASGRVNPEMIQSHRLGQEILIGFEFSGKDLSGRRIAAMTNNQGISSHVTLDSSLVWKIPDSWTLEDAATVPVVYSTVIYALLMVGDLKPGSSVLIHSATGGIGLAALNICFHYKCEIYVTVGTQEKRAYLKKNYPQIPDNHIGNSRDTSFEQMIRRETRNKGVDMILNSLSEDKLQASIRCLARGGKFMEIGKYDLANDSSLNLLFMEKEATYHGILLDEVFNNFKEMKLKVVEHLMDGIEAGFVKPLPRIVFRADEVEKSYRYMMTGKHIGRILIKLRNEEEEDSVSKFQIMSNPRFHCDVRYTYIVIGGLGGVGLELGDWLILRGARKLVLTSRSGIQNGHHQQRINIWTTYGVEVKISTKDVTTERGCEDLIKEANKLGPVDAIFNLAVVLKDTLFENQTHENFETSLAPKARATLYLDRVTRKLCPKLRYFVIFSSVSCGRGNPGQSNYGMANSVMERICENRKREGLPAVAIQWGAIGEVGLVAKMQKENKELVIGGTLQQKISSCLEVLDVLLKHKYPVVSSMVVAKKYDKSDNLSAVEAVAHVVGIKDMKTISQYTTFAELGMDSLMGTEIIQLLEKDFGIYVTSKDVRSLTFAKLTEMEAEKMKASGEVVNQKIEEGTNLLIQSIPNSETIHLPVVKFNSQVEPHVEAPIVLVLPGVEGIFTPLEYLTNSLKAHVIGVQYTYKNSEDSIEELAQNTLPHIENYLTRTTPFYIIGYSFGTLVALEMISLLEKNGYTGILILIDGSPAYSTSSLKKQFAHETEAQFQTAILSKIASFVISLDVFSQYEETLLKCKDFEERINLFLALIPPETNNKQKLEKRAGVALYHRCKALLNYTFKNKKIKSSVHLFKAKHSMVDEEDDYQLSKISENLAEVITIDGDHVTILKNPDLVKGVNEIVVQK
ncbi:fatty acid synthase-like [Zophobas morio]|uniref:fatty acid synthase-like n=1 Tax=Zophobas morio TaxID=2755281 RepID=UPI0030835B62